MTIKTPIATFVLGIAVSVAFYKLAVSRGDDARASRPADAPSSVPAAATNPASRIPVPATSPTRTAAVGGASEIARLRELAAEMRERAKAAEEQLELAEGHPVVWPHEVPAAYQREAVEKQLKEFVVDRGIGKIKRIECAEYPCVEVLQLSDNGPDALHGLQASLNEMIKRYYEGPVSLIISSSQSADGGSIASISVVPDDDEVKNRTRHRASGALQDDAP
jgi:hypothetical protein